MRFEIKLVEVSSNVEEIKEIADKIESIESSISDIENNFKLFHISSINSLKNTLRKQRLDIQDYHRKMDVLGDSLIAIVQKYDDCEKEVCDKETVGLEQTKGSPVENTYLQAEISDAEKEKVIRDYEKKHQKEAEIFDKFLDGDDSGNLTKDDIRNIKFLVYTSEEPFISIYLKSLSKYKIKTTNLDKGAYYQPWKHSVSYTYPDSFNEDPRGPYTTFFHEGGHAIDDLSDKAKWIGSDTEKFRVHSEAMDKEVTLREAIEYDVYYNKDNPHSMTSIANKIIASKKSGSDGNIKDVIDAFKFGNTSKLNKDDLKLYNAVKNEYLRTTGKDERYEAVSDVYGGMSNNELRTGYGHDTNYWKDKSKVGKELWAEYFSYNMAGDTENIRLLVEYFPEASKFLEQYANALGE